MKRKLPLKSAAAASLIIAAAMAGCQSKDGDSNPFEAAKDAATSAAGAVGDAAKGATDAAKGAVAATAGAVGDAANGAADAAKGAVAATAGAAATSARKAVTGEGKCGGDKAKTEGK